MRAEYKQRFPITTSYSTKSSWWFWKVSTWSFIWLLPQWTNASWRNYSFFAETSQHSGCNRKCDGRSATCYCRYWFSTRSSSRTSQIGIWAGFCNPFPNLLSQLLCGCLTRPRTKWPNLCRKGKLLVFRRLFVWLISRMIVCLVITFRKLF